MVYDKCHGNVAVKERNMRSNSKAAFLRVAIVAVFAIACQPIFAQISDGLRNAPPIGNLSQRVAAARAEFPALLEKALSPESLAALAEQIKASPQPNISGVNFDNINAPCYFADTNPLRGQEQGAGFITPIPSGGAVLNECSNFGLYPVSAPNFLAFNTSVRYADGGVAALPELILVGSSKSSVSMWVSGGDHPGFPISAIALNSSGAMIGMVNATTTTAWAQLTINASGVSAVYLTGNPEILLIDNIQIQ
ncbi:MAG TPA: hypothetical protein VMT86_03690 [Bryobacteraceae bacterium]|nr:hypothetical protein [Bryobacteraceae bacterium]